MKRFTTVPPGARAATAPTVPLDPVAGEVAGAGEVSVPGNPGGRRDTAAGMRVPPAKAPFRA